MTELLDTSVLTAMNTSGLGPAGTHPAALLAESGLVLMSFWKPILILLVMVPWLWVISKIYDKHTAQFHLPRRQWNTFHLCVGMLAVALGVLLPSIVGGPWSFMLGLGAMVVVLVIDLVAYAVVANKDDRVPERFHIKLNMEQFAENKAKKAAAKMQAKVALAVFGPDDRGKLNQAVAAPQVETPEYDVRLASERVYISAMEARSSQIDIGPTGRDSTYGVSFMVDGVRQAGETMPGATAARLMDFWRAAAKLDVNDRRKKQVGSVQVEKDGVKHILRVSSIGAQGGMRLSMLVDPEQQVMRKVTELGLLESQAAELKKIVEDGKGVVLLSAPADAGRTTTLYTILKMHDAYTSNVQTVEIDVQAGLEGVRGNKWDPQATDSAAPAGAAPGTGGGEFSTLVRSILRRDPDVVGVAELPDPQTAKEIARSDHDRTRVYLSFRAGDALTAVQAYCKAVGDNKQAGASLHGALSQRLVRKLCVNCRVAYPPSPDMLKKLGIPEGKVTQLFKKGGQVLIKNRPEVCPVCNGVGFHGQSGVIELFPLDAEDREMVSQGNFQGLKASLRKKQLPTIQQVAIRKAIDGVTSVEEVLRITAAERPPEGSASQPAAEAVAPSGKA